MMNNKFMKRANNTTTEAATLSNKEMNKIYTNYEKTITSEKVGNLEFNAEQTLRMNVIALFRRKVDPVTKAVIGVGTLTIESVIFRAIAREALELRKAGIEGTADENKACENILRTYLNAEVVEAGKGSGVKYVSVFEDSKNTMLAQYSNASHVLREGQTLFANIQMQLFKTGNQQGDMFNERVQAMDCTKATIKDIITMVMDAQHISRLIQETSIDMDKKYTLSIGFTLGRILNKELKAAASVLKKNTRKTDEGMVDVVTSNAAEVRRDANKAFTMDINLGDDIVNDESVVTSNAIMQGAVEKVNELFMPLLSESVTLEIVANACAFATKHYNDAVEIAKLLDVYNGYNIESNMTVGEKLNTQKVEDSDKESVIQAIKNSIINIKEIGGYTNEEFTKLVWGASCKTKVQDANGKTVIAFIATEEKEYARRLFKEQILKAYSKANLDGTAKETTEIYSDAVDVIPTIATEDKFEADNTLEFKVEFVGKNVIDVATGNKIAVTANALSGKGYVGMDEFGKIKAVKVIELTDEFTKEGDLLVAPINMVCVDEAMRVNYRAVKTDYVVSLEESIKNDINIIKNNFTNTSVYLANNYKKTLCVFGEAITFDVKDADNKGNGKYTKSIGIDSAIMVKSGDDLVPVCSLSLGNTTKLSTYFNLEDAKRSHDIAKTQYLKVANDLNVANANRIIKLEDIKYYNGSAIAIYKLA